MAPFTIAPCAKTPSDYLIDYMADIAALLKDAKDTQLEAPEVARTDLEYQARAIQYRLFSWRWDWLARNRSSVLEVESESAEVFGTVFSYSRPELVYETWLCDALMIFILGFLNSSALQERLTTPPRPHGALWKPDEALSAQYLAVEICRSLEYQLEHLSFPAAAHQWAMPVALAYVALSPTDPVAEWVYAKILAAPESRRVPWLLYIERLQGKDQDAAKDLFALWPISRTEA